MSEQDLQAYETCEADNQDAYRRLREYEDEVRCGRERIARIKEDEEQDGSRTT